MFGGVWFGVLCDGEGLLGKMRSGGDGVDMVVRGVVGLVLTIGWVGFHTRVLGFGFLEG